jgi:hypothetical protein
LQSVSIVSTVSNKTTSVQISAGILTAALNKINTTDSTEIKAPAISVAVFADDTLFIRRTTPPSVTTTPLPGVDTPQVIEPASLQVGTPVMSIDIEGVEPGTQLESNITMAFKTTVSIPAYGTDVTTVVTVLCSWWNETLLDWEQSGCEEDPTLRNGTHIFCSCSHLTAFAALMSVQEGSAATGSAAVALDVITYALLSISSILMAFTFLTHVKAPKVFHISLEFYSP